MALITLPTPFQVSRCSLALDVNQRLNASPFGGSEQAVDMLNDRWRMSLEVAVNSHAQAAAIDAFIDRLRAQVNTCALYHFARPTVRGTIAGAKTLSAGAPQGASSVSITATGTLLAGDHIGISTPGGVPLLLRIAADCTSSAGVITAPLANRLRAALSSGAAVTTTNPTAWFRLASASAVQYQRGFTQPCSLDFVEAVS